MLGDRVGMKLSLIGETLTLVTRQFPAGRDFRRKGQESLAPATSF